MNKVFPDAKAALHDVSDGAVILAGGFGLSGNPENCIAELARRKVNNLTIVSNNCGTTEQGIEAFYVPTGYGTKVAEGKETREIGGKHCVLEHAIRGDFAIVKAWKADRWGNLVFNKTSRNFNPLCAQAGKITIVEVEELVEVGELDPDLVHLPSIYVQRIFQGTNYEKPIEQRTVRPASARSA